MVVAYCDEVHRKAVVELWTVVFGYETTHNEPSLAIDKKLAVEDGLFFVKTEEERVVGTIMAGYDGHRGWLYSLAVAEDCRGRGLGSELVRHAETALRGQGCVKINLQILEGNEGVESFYHKLGFVTEPRINLGRVLP